MLGDTAPNSSCNAASVTPFLFADPSMLKSAAMPSQKPAYTSPYHVFCREQRPLLPAGIRLKNSDREKVLGQMWKELSPDGREAYEQGLTQLASSGRGGLRAWAPALATKLPAPPLAAISATFLAGGAAVNSVAVPALVPALEQFDQFDATLPVQERATFWAAPERAAKTSPPSAAEDQPAAKRRACEENQGNSKPYLYDAQLWSNRAACALLIRNRQYAHSAPPASVPAPLPAVEQAVAQQIGEEGAVGGGASEGELERGRHAPEGGYSDGELDRILQEQLARLRSSWSHAS